MIHKGTSRCGRLAIVISHPTQYYSPWFRWIAQHTSIDCRVFYLWDAGVRAVRDPRFGTTFAWDVDLLTGYESEFVRNVAPKPGTDRFAGLWNPSLLRRLKAWKPDAILCFGYAYATHLMLIAGARLARIPLIFRGDSHFIDRGPPRGMRAWMLRGLYSQFAAVTYVGNANRGYYRDLGVPEDKLHFAPHAVDASLFNPANPKHLENATRLRARLGIDTADRVILFAGKFHPEKQPLALLEVFLALDEPNVHLVFVGDGAQRELLVQRAAGCARVHFLPFANQTEMPARYLLADLYVLPSSGLHETWGLAVNEAMHMGVPCIVSHRVGCQSDLVDHGSTGWVFRAQDSNALRECLTSALRTDLQPIRANALRRVASYSFDAATRGLQAALEQASRSSR